MKAKTKKYSIILIVATLLIVSLIAFWRFKPGASINEQTQPLETRDNNSSLEQSNDAQDESEDIKVIIEEESNTTTDEDDSNTTNDQDKDPQASNLNITLYFNPTCPACQTVNNYLEKNKDILDEINLTKVNIAENKENLNQLYEKAALCDMDKYEVSIPFLWVDDECYIGSGDIIDLLKEFE